MINKQSAKSILPDNYDVYRTSDRRIAACNIVAKEAANLTGVSESFVIESASKKARNLYGRVASTTGFYFYIHGKIPDYEADRGAFSASEDPLQSKVMCKSKRISKRPDDTKGRWYLDLDKLMDLARSHGITTFRQLGVVCNTSLSSIYNYCDIPSKLKEKPRMSVTLAKICKELDCSIDDLFINADSAE